jgi:sugar O-acyltransferase (sialic acid O-acetyltransferase NeuD family)
LTYDSEHEVAGFAVEQQHIKSRELFGLPIIPFHEIERHYEAGSFRAFVAVSSTQLNRVRTRLYREVKRLGYQCVSYVSTRAFVWRNVEIGENCFILEGNVLQYGVRIGNNVVLWSGNHIGHQTVIQDNNFISSHVVVSGYCDIGESCFVGVNSAFADHVVVARDCFIGMGAVVDKNTEARKIYRGNPATPNERVDTFRMFRIKEDVER